MLPSNPPIVITAQDLSNREASSAESDCQSDARLYLTESDCACPTDDLSSSRADDLIQDFDSYVLPALYTDTCADNFRLAFNPLGQAGVVVLNHSAFTLLSGFDQPHTLVDGVNAAGNLPAGLETARRLVKLNLLNPTRSQRELRRSSPQTLTVWLHVTNKCNLSCPYCYVNKTPDAMNMECGRQAVAAVFRSAVANNFHRVKLKYAGGEATLNFHTVLILHDYARQLANEYGLELEGVVLSNGVALTNPMIAAMQARDIKLMISLDGVDEYHDFQRPFANGRGSFEYVERALDRLSDHNFKPSICITVSNRNLGGLPKVVDYVLRRELPFTLNFYRENECSTSFADLAYSDERLIGAMKAAFAVIEENPPPYSLLGVLVDRARLDMLHDRPCGVGHSYLVIDHHGGVAKCQMEIEQAITDVSVADPLRAIREDKRGVQNISVEEKEGCRQCTWRYWCAGGCPALTYRVTGRFDVKSPNCRAYKALFPEVLRLEGLRLLKHSRVPLA